MAIIYPSFYCLFLRQSAKSNKYLLLRSHRSLHERCKVENKSTPRNLRFKTKVYNLFKTLSEEKNGNEKILG